MPWLETNPVDQRSRFIDAYLSGAFRKTELCARFHISRRTGDKWIGRYDAQGRAGLGDQSRAPKHCPHRIADDVATLICAARRKHPDWGAGKLLEWVRPRHPDVAWPAVSTAGDLLKRRGLVQPRRRRYKPTHPGVVSATTHTPNDLWTADFKGEFRTGDDEYCYPLTVADLHSRYLLACTGLRSTRTHGAHAVFEQLFREYGLPRAIRTDNGVPFATHGAARALDAECVVAPVGNPASAHSAGVAAAERRPRAHAQNAQARRNPAAAGKSPGTATRVQSVSDALQRRAAPRELARDYAQLALSVLAPSVPKCATGDRVPGALPRPRDHGSGHVPVRRPALLSQ